VKSCQGFFFNFPAGMEVMAMNPVDFMACPRCKGGMTIEIQREDEFGVNEGRLFCESCQREYPIKEGIFYFLTEESGPSAGIGGTVWNMNEIEVYHQRMGEWQSLADWYKGFGLPGEVGEFRYERIQKRIIEFMELEDKCIILDDGCGIGYFIFDILDTFPNKDIYIFGIDISTYNIKGLNRRRRRENRKNVFGVIGDAQRLPFKSNTFNVVTSIEAIEHFIKPEYAVDEIYRVLKPSGKLFLSTPSKRGLNFWKTPFKKMEILLKRILDKKRITSQTGYSYYDNPLYPEELRKLLMSRSFNIKKFVRTIILFPSSVFGILPLGLTKVILKLSTLFEKHCLDLLLPLTISCVLECEKVAKKQP
jgi:ubiquinone/menaquinone biosynthesis C-methylase UbiE/uncharacterized protein YbaR (Trm112 family)